MPTIRISDRSWERLKAWAEPLEDTADSALSKVLDAAERHGSDGHKKEARQVEDAIEGERRLPKTPQDAFREPLLEVIYQQGGSGRPTDLRQPMKERMRGQLSATDFEQIKSGDERWWKSVNWARFDLVEDGYLRNDSPRGVWELSEKGIKLAESQLNQTGRDFADHLRNMPDVGDDSDFDRSSS